MILCRTVLCILQIYVCYICVSMDAHMIWHAQGCQNITFENLVSSSTVFWEINSCHQACIESYFAC